MELPDLRLRTGPPSPKAREREWACSRKNGDDGREVGEGGLVDMFADEGGGELGESGLVDKFARLCLLLKSLLTGPEPSGPPTAFLKERRPSISRPGDSGGGGDTREACKP